MKPYLLTIGMWLFFSYTSFQSALMGQGVVINEVMASGVVTSNNPALVFRDTFLLRFSEDISIEWNIEMPTCFGDSDGSITATISGGTPPITYEWSTGHKSEIADSTFSLWNFNGLVPSDSPPPTVGEGIALLIGEVNNPSTGTSGNGSSDPAADNDAWQTASYPSQGEDPRTAGVQFNISTVDYSDIFFSFDQRLSNTAANTWVLLYTTNHTADSVIWEEATVFRIEPQMSGTGNTWHNQRSHDFSGVEELNDNPNVAFRIVSDFDPETGQYEAVTLGSNYSGGGTSRFDMVFASGSPANRMTTIDSLSAGQYALTVTDGLGLTHSDTLDLPDPDPVPEPVILGPVELESGQLAVYEVESSDGIIGVNLFIVVDGGVVDSVIGDQTFQVQWDDVQPSEVLEGSISATVFNFVGCSADYFLPVEIMGPTSTDDLQSGMDLRVYPNPNRAVFEIAMDESAAQSIAQIEIFLSSGQLIRQIATVGREEISISLDGLSTGLLQVVFKDRNGEVRAVRPVVVLD